MIWIRKPQERDGSYFFSGQLHVTQAVLNSLTPDDILAIYLDIQMFVQENDGADYLQIYVNEKGDKLYLIDQLKKEMIESGIYEPEDNYYTLLFSWEY
jgi:hypothetical protein